MRLNWFSPLPPARTDIAHYSRRILPELAEAFDLVLWTNQSTWDAELETMAPVRRFSPDTIAAEPLLRQGLNVYHLGNNIENHADIWEASRALPGAVVLHDLTLFDFFGQYYEVRLRQEAQFVKLLMEEYGEGAVQHWREFEIGLLSNGYLSTHYPFGEIAVRGALGVLSHSPEAAQLLKLPAEVPLAFAPLPYRFKARDFSNQRAKYGDGPPYRIVVFGYIGKNRRVEQLLEAYAGLAEKDRFQIQIFGQLFIEAEIRAAINRFGLENHVRIQGFVTDEVLEDALSRAHLVVNLRHPSMGEASGSQLRIWDHALPSLVSRTRWYAALPENAVKFVGLGRDEVWDIQVHLRDFLKSPLHYAEMGLQGRRVLEMHHSPAAYVRRLKVFAEEVRLERTEAARILLDRVAAQVRDKLGIAPSDRDLQQWAAHVSTLTTPPAC